MTKFVERLLNHPEVPELIRTSPLTQREWQVLGLIYSGYSNEQIAGELDVAATTIKTHIRNLYQKCSSPRRGARGRKLSGGGFLARLAPFIQIPISLLTRSSANICSVTDSFRRQFEYSVLVPGMLTGVAISSQSSGCRPSRALLLSAI